MSNEKFIIEKVKPKRKPQGWRPITISTDVYEKILDISNETGLALSQVASRGLEFALSQLVIQD